MLDLPGKVIAKTEHITREEFDRDENLRLAVAHLLQTERTEHLQQPHVASP